MANCPLALSGAGHVCCLLVSAAARSRLFDVEWKYAYQRQTFYFSPTCFQCFGPHSKDCAEQQQIFTRAIYTLVFNLPLYFRRGYSLHQRAYGLYFYQLLPFWCTFRSLRTPHRSNTALPQTIAPPLRSTRDTTVSKGACSTIVCSFKYSRHNRPTSPCADRKR